MKNIDLGQTVRIVLGRRSEEPTQPEQLLEKEIEIQRLVALVDAWETASDRIRSGLALTREYLREIHEEIEGECRRDVLRELLTKVYD